MTRTAAAAAAAAQAKDILDAAVSASNFKTLVAPLGAADLVPTLKGSGPFTVFAPNDEAFSTMHKADLDALLKDNAKVVSADMAADNDVIHAIDTVLMPK